MTKDVSFAKLQVMLDKLERIKTALCDTEIFLNGTAMTDAVLHPRLNSKNRLFSAMLIEVDIIEKRSLRIWSSASKYPRTRWEVFKLFWSWP